jgi:hypothetical protein
MLKTRNSFCLFVGDFIGPDEPAMIADIRLLTTRPKVWEEIAAIITECNTEANSETIHARLISRLSDVVFYRGATRKPTIGKQIGGLLGRLAEVIAAYIAIRQLPEDKQ